MVKGFCSILLMSLLVTSIGIGGIKPVKKHIMDEPTDSNPIPVQERGTPGVQYGGLTWDLVDTSANCYGMLTNTTDPLTYDPVSGYVGVIHRAKTSYGAGSGELWYNTSPDGSMGSWTRIGALNGGTPIVSRYPSAWIASGAGAGSELFAFSAPQLTPGAFGYVVYGADPLNANGAFGVEDQGDASYWSNTRITAADDSPYIWWAAAHDVTTTTHASLLHLWRTMDYGTIDQSDPWPLSLFTTPGLEIGLAYRNGTLYASGYATFPGDADEVFNVFYTSSSDDGTTWSAPVGPNLGTGDWRTLPAIAGSPYDDWYDDPDPLVGNSGWDMQVDNMGYVHIFGVLQDSDDLTADRAVVEIYETASGWDAKFVAQNLAASTIHYYGTVDQMGYHVGSAASADGSKLVTVWLSAPAAGDTLSDIWMSQRNVADAAWSTPVNLSATPDFAELLLHVAPILRDDGGDMYTMFLSRSYEQGITSYPPVDTNPSDIFVTTVPVDFTTGVEPTSEFPSVYKLDQNYPNPFNPTTNIRYSIPNSSFVSLKVFDMLGQEVASLYNGYQDAGSYVADFDASNLANGTYYYTLTAGSFSETKKMLLLK